LTAAAILTARPVHVKVWHLFCVCEKTVGSGLEIDDGLEKATFQAPLGQLGTVTH
jgi:hypothetical protein